VRLMLELKIILYVCDIKAARFLFYFFII